MLNGAINYYNSILTTTYNKIATLETEAVHFWEELIKLSRGNIVSKTKMPEPPTFTGSENKIYLHDWLNQIALYCLASSIILDDQKINCALIRLHALTSISMKSYYNKVEARLSV